MERVASLSKCFDNRLRGCFLVSQSFFERDLFSCLCEVRQLNCACYHKGLIGVYAFNIRVEQEAFSWRIDQCDTVETGSFNGNVDLDHAGGVVELTFLLM